MQMSTNTLQSDIRQSVMQQYENTLLHLTVSPARSLLSIGCSVTLECRCLHREWGGSAKYGQMCTRVYGGAKILWISVMDDAI